MTTKICTSCWEHQIIITELKEKVGHRFSLALAKIWTYHCSGLYDEFNGWVDQQILYWLVMWRVALCCLFFKQQQPSRPNLRPLQDGSVDSSLARTLVGADARQFIVQPVHFCSSGKSMSLLRKKITLVSPDCGIPRKRGQLSGSHVEQFPVRLMERC